MIYQIGNFVRKLCQKVSSWLISNRQMKRVVVRVLDQKPKSLLPGWVDCVLFYFALLFLVVNCQNNERMRLDKMFGLRKVRSHIYVYNQNAGADVIYF